MMAGLGDAGVAGVDPGGLPEPEVLARLASYLTESIMVVRRDWSVSADLGPPGGMLGHGQATGMHPFSLMHPEDVEQVVGYATDAMRTEPGWRGRFEFRAQRADGTYALFQVDFHNRFDDPVLQGMVVVSREVASPEDAGSVLAALGTDLRIEAVGDHLPMGLLMLDRDGALLFANRPACEMLGADIDLLRSGQMPSALSAGDRHEVAGMIQRLRAAPGRETFTTEIGGPQPRLLSGSIVSRAGVGGGGEVEFMIVTMEDVTHRLAREQHLEHRANHDSLTGLPNRSWLLDRLNVHLERGDEIVVAFVDLDGFKTVNDMFGHAAGDDILSEVAASLRAALEPGEAVSRVGGDEFVVVAATGVDVDALRLRLRDAVSYCDGGRAHDLGASIGVTTSRTGDKPWDLLGRADAAMYDDKRRAV